ncbi:phage integrase family protein [Deferribacter autotrophicus]|uniref:Phage integrase family protein n=1 Tax=Deferribacter autotrophicus TaxID=500465 RepID=A0A5A8F6L1_9BACT|nr:tyrosine-type recombinase/integrase [Deferribacter autotrophicus]KAA0259083.1 phage integrase family protein [Deferribacter autotrophicus]
MKGSITKQVNYVWMKLDGIGTSKRESRNVSGKTGAHNQKVSDKVHSYRYKDEVLRTARELAQFARENFGIKDMEKIRDDVVKAYVDYKIEDGLTYRTISTYIAHLSKVAIGLEKIAEEKGKEYKAFSREFLKEVRQEAKQHAVKNIHQNRAYSNPEKIIANLSAPEHKLVAELQLNHGLRVIEASRFSPEQLKEDNKIEYVGKGGKMMEKVLDSALYDKLKSNVEKAVNEGKVGFEVDYQEFLKDLKRACEIIGEEYHASHGFRYNYAQNRLMEYINEGYSPDEARQLVSEDLGHNRPEITKHYL